MQKVLHNPLVELFHRLSVQCLWYNKFMDKGIRFERYFFHHFTLI